MHKAVARVSNCSYKPCILLVDSSTLGGTDRLLVATGGTLTGNLAQIDFFSGSTATLGMGGDFVGMGAEVSFPNGVGFTQEVAVPEPSTIFGALCLFGLSRLEQPSPWDRGREATPPASALPMRTRDGCLTSCGFSRNDERANSRVSGTRGLNFKSIRSGRYRRGILKSLILDNLFILILQALRLLPQKRKRR
jgi:hypothetical protein